MVSSGLSRTPCFKLSTIRPRKNINHNHFVPRIFWYSCIETFSPCLTKVKLATVGFWKTRTITDSLITPLGCRQHQGEDRQSFQTSMFLLILMTYISNRIATFIIQRAESLVKWYYFDLLLWLLMFCEAKMTFFCIAHAVLLQSLSLPNPKASNW